MTLKKILLLVISLASFLTASAQVGIGTTNPDASSILDLTSTSKGFLPPRMTTTDRDAIASPSEGLVVFNTTKQCLEIYNLAETTWKSLCGDESSSAEFSPDCATLSVNGTYYTGVELDGGTNYISLNVNVTELGSYAVLCNAGGMVFVDSGTFSALGTQQIILRGQGFPANQGLNYLSFAINNTVCSAVVNVQNGLAIVSSCGTATLSGQVIAGQTYASGDLSLTLDGINYTGGDVYGISTSDVNGIALSSPLQGSFSSVSPATLELEITGTPLIPGNTVLNYEINTQSGCTVTVPVTSGTGLASGVTCTGTLSGTYQVATAMTASNTKVISLTVSTTGTFNLRTNTENGVYFSVNYTAGATGAQNVTLTATGTPLASGTYTYTVNVSNAATTFVSCAFNVTFAVPSGFPNFDTPRCAPLGAAYTYVKASNTQASDFFFFFYIGTTTNRLKNRPFALYGSAKAVKMSADGLTLVVGAMGEDATTAGGQINNGATNQGATYIYTRANTTPAFAFQAYIKATNGGANDYFGNSIDISNDGNTVIIGATGEDGNGTGVNPVDNNSSAGSGAAYVFTRSGSTWSQLAYLKANNTAASDYFGYNVAVSGDGNRFAVSAMYEDGSSIGVNGADNNSANNAGAVYVFNRSGSTITFGSRVKSNNIGADDYFGASLDLDDAGTTLAVGAPTEDGSGLNVNPASNNSFKAAGAAYTFFFNGTTWAQQAYIKPSNTTANQRFGYDVSLAGNGNRLVVGAPEEDGTLVASTGTTNSGAVYLYERSGSTWTTKQRIKADNFGASDAFGFRVQYSNDGTTIAVGSPWEDTSVAAATCTTFTPNNSLADSGAVYLFKDNVSSFIQSGFVKMRTESTASAGATASDYLGYSVTLSGDGKSVATGMPSEDGSSMNVNNAINNGAGVSGAVMVFTAN